MSGMRSFFTQKTVWGGLLAVIAAIALLGWAILGSTVNPVPKNMPLALVVADKGADIPGAGKVNIGETLEQKLTGGETPTGEPSPFVWTVLGSEREALDGLDRQQYYAAVVLPDNLSAAFVSLLSPSPQTASVRVLVNQGKNAAAATMVTQAVGKMLEGINTQLREQALGQLQQRQGPGAALSAAQAKALAAPLAASFETVHPIVANTANGNAPVVLTQLAWIGALAASALLYLTASKLKTAGRFGLTVSVLLAGAVYAAVGAAAELAIADYLFGLEVPDWPQTLLFLMLALFSFFLLQTAVLSWIGLKGMPLLVLLFFFGLPLLNLPPEFLPDATRDWLYAWIPFRFSAEGLRDLFYFRQGLNVGGPVSVLVWIGIAGAAVTLASAWKRRASGTRTPVAADSAR